MSDRLGREACSEAGIEKSHVVRQASIEDKQQGGKGRQAGFQSGKLSCWESRKTENM